MSDRVEAELLARDCDILRDSLMSDQPPNESLAALAAYVSCLAANVARLRDTLNL